MSDDVPNSIPILRTPTKIEIEGAGTHYKWKPEIHASAITATMKEWHREGKMTDVTINCDGKLIHANMLVLASIPYLWSLLENAHLAENPTIVLTGVKYESVKALIELLYTGKAKVSRSALVGLLDVTKVLHARKLRRMIARHLWPSTPALGKTNDSKIAAEVASALLMLGNGPNKSKLDRKPLQGSSHSAILDRQYYVPESKGSSSLAVAKYEPKGQNRGKRIQMPMTTVPIILKTRKENFGTHSHSLSKSSLKLSAPALPDEEEGSSVPYFDPNSGKVQLTVNADPYCFSFVSRSRPTNIPSQARPMDLTVGSPINVRPGSSRQSLSSRPCEASPKPSQKHDEAGTPGSGSGIRRPPNAFLFFSNAKRKLIASENPALNNKGVSVLLGQIWKQLGREGQEEFYKTAEEAAEQHKKLYPNYVYSPKEARIQKEMKKFNNMQNKSPAEHYRRRLYENVNALLSPNEDTNSSSTLTANEDVNHFLRESMHPHWNGSAGTCAGENADADMESID